ncbi:retinol-binding protein pinta-like [Tenebrio molitor]|uniref:retinol-binding protein pinta-like n=1 Tax=Tenebrio molitor TaxID=7067 RepID=UPI003624A230
MDLLMVTPDEKKRIREYYNLSEDQIKEDVERIKSWKEKQPHLPYDVTDEFIEIVLLRNKVRMERTKQKLDNYFSLRWYLKDLIENMENIIPSQQVNTCLPMPKLTPSLERIVIVKFLDTDPDRYSIPNFIKLHFAIEELCLRHDYSIGTRFVYDFEGTVLKHTLKWNPITLAKFMTYIERSYSCRILGFEFINCSTFLNKIIAVLKVVMRAKIYEKVTIHEDMASVHKVIPKECLPKEYGGTMENIPDLIKKWDEMMKNHHEFFVKNYKNVLLSTSLEELRPLDVNDQGGFGVDGTFRKLQID